jgi:3-hydroxy-3-methylglutaryl CoA synthase/uncharacterized OB-fold protein
MRGIDAAAAYLPRFRLSTDELADAWESVGASGIENRTVPAADEDALTMAAAAAERALDRAAVGPRAIESVAVATTTPPLEEGPLAARLGRMVGLHREAALAEHTQGTLAGAEALDGALRASGPALVVAADCPAGDPADADHRMGAGAAAFVVTDDAAVDFGDRAWYADEYPGVRYRERGSTSIDSLGTTSYEREAMRECLAGAIAGIDALDAAEGNVHAAAIHQPDASVPSRVTSDLPFDTAAVERGIVVDRIGDAGAAGVPLGLCRALSSAGPDDRVVGAFFGGGAAAFVFEGGLGSGAGFDDALAEDLDREGTQVTYTRYLRERGIVAGNEVAGGGAHVSVPNWRRTLDQRYRLLAGRCPDCGALAFPPEGACPGCHARVEYERVALSRTGTVTTLTTIGQGGAPPEFADQQARDGHYGAAIIELEAEDGEADGDSIDGGTVTLPAQLTDCDPGEVETDEEVRAAIRRIYTQEGVPRYGVKFTPVG